MKDSQTLCDHTGVIATLRREQRHQHMAVLFIICDLGNQYLLVAEPHLAENGRSSVEISGQRA